MLSTERRGGGRHIVWKKWSTYFSECLTRWQINRIYTSRDSDSSRNSALSRDRLVREIKNRLLDRWTDSSGWAVMNPKKLLAMSEQQLVLLLSPKMNSTITDSFSTVEPDSWRTAGWASGTLTVEFWTVFFRLPKKKNVHKKL